MSVRRPALVVVALVLAGCGYQSVHAGAGREHLHVVLASSKVPDAIASDEVLAGVRESLARSASLAAGDGYPRCEVEVLRADEASEGIAASTNVDGRLLPESRATRVGIVARAWVIRAPGEAPTRDTGDVRAGDATAVAGSGAASAFQADDAYRAAARRVGQKLGLRVLGLPTSSED